MGHRVFGSRIGLVIVWAGLGLAACSTPVVEIDVQATVDVMLTEAAPAATAVPTEAPTAPPAPSLSFEAELYRDASAGFEFDYPATWVVGPVQPVSYTHLTLPTN